jgi:hypothetical protein
MNATFNFYQAIPSAPPPEPSYVSIPVAVPLVEESTEQKYEVRKKILGILACWGIIFLVVYLLIFWANHDKAS